MADTLTITKAGISCIQDLGRRGWSRFGLPVNGAADQYSASVANVLVGSPRGAALIEITVNPARLAEAVIHPCIVAAFQYRGGAAMVHASRERRASAALRL